MEKLLDLISFFVEFRNRYFGLSRNKSYHLVEDSSAMTSCLPKQRSSPPQQQVLLADFCKALGHPIRIEIMKILIAKGECLSGDLAVNFDKAPSTISEHLKILKEANLVLGTIDGPKRCYCVNPLAMKELQELIQGLLFDPHCCQPNQRKE